MHISGVNAPQLIASDMRDEHRIRVDSSDRLGNGTQIAKLAKAGYEFTLASALRSRSTKVQRSKPILLAV